MYRRFYRGKQSAGIDGVGIGLYLTRDIINKQKGYIKDVYKRQAYRYAGRSRLHLKPHYAEQGERQKYLHLH